MYRYFIQPQLNKFTKSLIGYEMLIRKFEDGHWQLPKNFASIPIHTQVELLKQTAVELSLKIGSVSINLNRSQFVDQEMAAALLDAQHHIYPVSLIVEVTEESVDKDISEEQMLKQIDLYQQHGIQLSLDDVGTGENTFINIEPLLDGASEIKLAMQNFRQEKREYEIPEQVVFWNQVAKNYNLRLIIEGMESEEEDRLLDNLKIPFRQGYYYGKPHLFKLKEDRKKH
ncbi:EAL domain-containing protein [Agrilactobacillus yilanensis]|uniref:EAL domain-containing protein n=1 Tax=Agrilactobacillus yilanensis TaxID=2485997 RepID=A0ABW4J5I1_9LACO|nr:EAL domain-containing protein [Agrilactobacillus yilanensis]